MNAIAPSSSAVYYHGHYWNNRLEVARELQRRATGSADLHWTQHVKQHHGKPFDKALVLNCGNGWVERGMLTSGVVHETIGTDIAEDLLQQARDEAATAGVKASYMAADINTFDFALEGVDLVVNHAAAHHIARLDQVMRAVCRMLPDDGIFVSWDYVGPHRNQYPTHQWEAIWALNQQLPANMQKTMRYPHMATMLRDDPTEAIHSELILDTMRRYFDLEHVRYLGGALAYELLTFNDAFFDDGDHTALVEHILAEDLAYLGDDPEHNTLFAYVVARPRKSALEDTEQLAEWTREEEEREAHGVANGGRYHPPTFMESLYDYQYLLEQAAHNYGAPHVEPHSPAPVPGRRKVLRKLAAIPGARTAKHKLDAVLAALRNS